MSGLLLGIDVGTTRGKALAIDGSGVERAAASVETPFAKSAHGVDMEVADLEQALAAALTALGPAREQLAGVGVAGMAESGAPLRGGRAVGPIIAWHDGRGEKTVASLEARFGPALPRWTGRRVRTVSSLAKLGWLIDQGITAPDRWLGVPELALFLLTGAEATEHSLAARTGAYDVTDLRFLPEVTGHVLAGSGSDPERLFPPVRSAGEAMGFVTREAAARYGIPAGIPVTIAGHDHLAAAAGLGGKPGDLFNSVGTAETVIRRVGSPPDLERTLALDLAVTVWPGGTSWGILASAARAGVVLGELAAALGRTPVELDRLAAEPGSDAGRRWSAAIADLVARTMDAGARVAELAGAHRRLVVFGGGSRSALWLATKAAAAGVPVLRSTVADAAARGAALAAGAAAGWWPAGAGPGSPLEAISPGPATMKAE